MNAEPQAVTGDELPDIAPIVVDLSAPNVYAEQVRLARLIQRFIAAMPLEALVAMADDQIQMGFIREATRDEFNKLRADRSLLAGLLSAQKHAKWVRARYGE